jgi:hypothetical protein
MSKRNKENVTIVVVAGGISCGHPFIATILGQLFRWWSKYTIKQLSSGRLFLPCQAKVHSYFHVIRKHHKIIFMYLNYGDICSVHRTPHVNQLTRVPKTTFIMCNNNIFQSKFNFKFELGRDYVVVHVSKPRGTFISAAWVCHAVCGYLHFHTIDCNKKPDENETRPACLWTRFGVKRPIVHWIAMLLMKAHDIE